MATTTLNILLPEFARMIGAFAGSYTTTATIGSSAESFTSSEINDRGYDDDDVIEDFYVRFTSGNNDDEIRRITGFTASTSVATIAGTTSSSAETGNITFELYDRDPQELIDALNMARYGAYPALHRQVRDVTVITNVNQHRYTLPSAVKSVASVAYEPQIAATSYSENIVADLDCDFEGDLSDWTVTGDSTLTAQTGGSGSPRNYAIFRDAQSGKIIPIDTSGGASSSTDMTLSVPDPTRFHGQAIHLSSWVYNEDANSNSTVALMIDINSGNVTVGTAAAASEGWQKITVTANAVPTVPGTAITSIDVGYRVVSPGNVFLTPDLPYTPQFVDEFRMTVGPDEDVGLFDSGSIWNWRQHEDVLEIRQHVPDRHVLVITGTGVLSSVSAGSDTMEVSEEQYPPLFAAAQEHLLQSEMEAVEGNEFNINQRSQTHWRNKAARNEMALPSLKRGNG